MLGIVAILTGILHMSGLMRFQRTVNKRHTRSGKILGTFEIGLGLVLIIAGPLQDNPLLALIASGWALVGGVALLYDAIVMRRTGWRMSWIDSGSNCIFSARDHRDAGRLLTGNMKNLKHHQQDVVSRWHWP